MTEGQINQLSDLYLEIITGKQIDETLFHSLIEQFKQDGYKFEPLVNDYVIGLYQRLKWVQSEKLKAINEKAYEHAHDLRNEENRLIEKMNELAYFTETKKKAVTFLNVNCFIVTL